MIEHQIPPPVKRGYVKRTTDEMKAMQPGDSVLLDLKGAHALKATAKYKGWKISQQKQACGNIRVWRIS